MLIVTKELNSSQNEWIEYKDENLKPSLAQSRKGRKEGQKQKGLSF
jgi:hypothetical protein